MKLVYVYKHKAISKNFKILKENKNTVSNENSKFAIYDFIVKKLCYRIKVFIFLKEILIIHYFIYLIIWYFGKHNKIKLLLIIVEL